MQPLKEGSLHIQNSLCEKILGVNFDYKLNCAKHIEDICQKVSRKLNALARLAPYTLESRIIGGVEIIGAVGHCNNY